MLVALCGRGVGRVAGHSRRARRHDDGRLWVALGDTAVDTLLIIRPVASQRGDRAVDLVEQGTNLRAIIGILVGQYRGDDPPSAGIHADVELLPGPALAGSMLLGQPLASTTELQPRAVYQQVDGLSTRSRCRSRHRQRLGSAAQG